MVARQRSCETIGGYDAWKLGKEVGDRLRVGEERGTERRRWLRRRSQPHGRRRATKNLLVGHVQEKVVKAAKIRPKNRNRDRS